MATKKKSKLGDALKAYTKNPAIGVMGSIKPPTMAKIQAPPAPAPPPPPPAAAPMPWDANYETRVGQVNRDRDHSLAGLAKEETDVKQAYGFDDVSNPFNRLAMLQKAFAQSKAGNLNGYASMGLGRSSALNNAQNETQHGYDRDYDTTRRDYDAALNSITQRRTGVTTGASDAITTADWERTQAALANRPDPASVPAPAAAATKPFTEQRGTDSKGNPGKWHTYPPSAQYPKGRKVFVKDKP